MEFPSSLPPQALKWQEEPAKLCHRASSCQRCLIASKSSNIWTNTEAINCVDLKPISSLFFLLPPPQIFLCIHPVGDRPLVEKLSDVLMSDVLGWKVVACRVGAALRGREKGEKKKNPNRRCKTKETVIKITCFFFWLTQNRRAGQCGAATRSSNLQNSNHVEEKGKVKSKRLDLV